MFLLLPSLLTSTLLFSTSTWKPFRSNDSNHSSHDRLRIIQINDVYKLDNMPHLKTLIAEQGKDDDDETTAIVICAGDFLSPSLLSSLDKGASMVDTMNAVGVTHVCLGNHEADVGDEALAERMNQSQFTWLNTNMPQLGRQDCVPGIENVATKCPAYDIVKVGTRRVALLGLLTDDPSLYRPGAFGDAVIQPIVTATEMIQTNDLVGVDLIVPLTHQGMAEDRAFCRHFAGKFPVVCGGHDHEMFDETVEGGRIIKTGMDATHAAVIDIQWDKDDNKPQVHVQMIPTTDYDPDPDLKQRIKGHQKILDKLKQARIFRIADWMDHYDSNVFSTRDNRVGPSTGTSVIATLLRMGMRVGCGIINAGSVRGNRDYQDQEYFAWSDLKAEMPFSSAMTVVNLPGHVLEATIAGSRRRALESKEASGAYLHGCSNIQFSDDTMKLEYVAGETFQPNRSYLTALPFLLLSGLDNHTPLLEWAQVNGIQPKHGEESGIPAKMIIINVFSMLLWLQLGSFEDIDKNKDGVVCRQDVKKRVLEVYGDDTVADLVVNSIFSVADMNNDGTISPLEMMIVQFCATDLTDHVCTQKELATMKHIASKVLGKEPSHDQVKRMVANVLETFDSLDDDIDGQINRNEVLKAIGDFDAEEMDLLQ